MKKRVKRVLQKLRHFIGKQWVLNILIGILIGVVGTVVGTQIYDYLSTRGLEIETDQIKQLIRREADLVMQQPRTEDMARQYGDLFDEKAWIVDRNNSKLWENRLEILERFYSLEEFKMIRHTLEKDPEIIGNDSAIAITSTQLEFIARETAISEIYMAREIWTFQKIGGQWKIICLQLNPPKE